MAVHIGLVAAAFLVTWTVIAERAEPPAPVIVADFESLSFAPLAQLAEAPALAERPLELPPVELPSEPPVSMPADDLPALDLMAPAAAAMPAAAATPSAMAPTPAASRLGANFVGLSTSNAREIVYVIDASGSMIRTLPIVLEELRRSLERLDPVQSFAVLFFQGDRFVRVPGSARLTPARPDEIDRQLAWVTANVVPEGRSNPLAALEEAVRLEPDVVFVLSENITGSGEFEIDADELLRRLNQINPRDPETSARRVTINCIQFLDPDPRETLRRIATAHGGPGGYKFLDRAELGLARP
ncbi:MAG: vWA domain-containing protein [Planctomycetota bacterium]|jgi:hypothetical protein